VQGELLDGRRRRIDFVSMDSSSINGDLIMSSARPAGWQAAVSRHLVARQRGAQPPKQQRRENLMELVAGRRVN